MTPLLDRTGAPVRRGKADWPLSESDAERLHNARLIEPLFRGRSRRVVSAWQLCAGVIYADLSAALRGPVAHRLPMPPPTCAHDPDVHLGYKHTRTAHQWNGK